MELILKIQIQMETESVMEKKRTMEQTLIILIQMAMA